jgi:hypothetical protein
MPAQSPLGNSKTLRPEVASISLQADHLLYFTSNHSSPIAATINTTMVLHSLADVLLILDDFCRVFIVPADDQARIFISASIAAS